MKKQILIAILFASMIVPATVFGQSGFSKLYDKYAGQDGFTSINISPEMFSFFSAIDVSDSSEEVKSSQDVIKQLSGLKMLVYEVKDGDKMIDLASEIKNYIDVDKYVDLMSVKDDESDIKFLAQKNSKNNLSELLMIISGGDEVVIMSMTGDIDLNTVSKLASELNIDQMSNLEKLENK